MTSRFSLSLALLTGLILLTACGVDTTGLSSESTRTMKGPETAIVTVTEYADFQCPSCASASTLINKPLLEKYGSRLRFEFRHFPLRAIHAYAYEAAQAAECAADQGKFWEFAELSYLQQKDLSSAAIRTWGAGLGLDADLFDRCIRSGIKGETIAADIAEGEKLGVQGTPSYLVNGMRVQTNNLEAISAAVDEVLKKANNAPL